MLGEETYLSLTASELLRRMDAAGVSTALARPLGAGLIVDNRAGNDLVLSAGPRIRGLVSANPWWGDRGLAELDRCREVGAVGMFLDPLRQGFFPTEPAPVPFYERAQQYDWPIVFRTGAYVFADVLAVVEVARRFPTIQFVAGFGGFADMWFEIADAIGSVPNLHLDASLLWSDGIEEIIKRFGAQRVLFGSAEPRNRYAAALRTLDRLELSTAEQEAIFHGNATRIFHLEPLR
ncbi:MAG: amidohydrolase family protein [Pirellulales bacterium]|nr:amidohydrolase family protein [Pirellulales bacterium]